MLFATTQNFTNSFVFEFSVRGGGGGEGATAILL